MAVGASVLGVFAHVDTTIDAIRQLRAKGFSNLTVYSPVPVEEIEEEMEHGRPLSKVRLFSIAGALTGTATAFFLTIWTSMKWELVTGGKDPVSIPPFIIIAFELSILLCGLATLLSVLVLAKLPKVKPVADLRPALHRRPLRGRGELPTRQRRRSRGPPDRRGRRGSPPMMKYVFLLVLLVVGAGRA